MEQDGQPPSRRLVGIALGIAWRHSVRVLEADGRLVCRSSCVPTVESLTLTGQAALAGAPQGGRLAVVFEPTGPAWLPIAVFFARRGHDVYRVSSAKAADLRRFLRRHAKSNGIDAETLARMPLAGPGGLQALELPGAAEAAPGRRVRACDRLTRAGSEHKVRIKDLVRQLMPMTPLTGDLGKADLAVLERYGDPRALLTAGPAELTRLITSASGHQQGKDRALQWRAAAKAALDLYGDDLAVPFAELATEVATEVRLLRAIQASWRPTPTPVNSTTGRPIPASWPAPCPASPTSVPRSWSPSWDGRAASATPPGSSPTPAWPHGRARLGRLTARARP